MIIRIEIMADIKSLEHPTLKVPYEILNKKFRVAQKNIDREVSQIQNVATELEKLLQKSGVTVSEVSTVLSGLEEKLTHLKRKADECIQDESGAAMACKRRLEHMKESESLPAAAQTQWKKKRLDRMLVEYFLRAGYYRTAIQLADHSDIKDLTNIDLFLVSKDVEESLASRDTTKCLAWCYDNKSKLRKMKSTLEFNLRQQEFIELIRSGNRLDAVLHARKYFTNAEDDQLKAVQNSMGLLAFASDTQLEPYKDTFANWSRQFKTCLQKESLMDPERWNVLVQQFRQENFKLYQLNNHSVFTVALNAGLSALKTHHCYRADGSGRNAECPVCSKHLNSLAGGLPYAHCSNSRLICSISGEPMNEHNPPMMLPNGYVYGLNALGAKAEQHEGQIVCPRTKEIFSIDQIEKVFVM